MTMNGDPRAPESHLPSGAPEEGAARTDTPADLGEGLRADLAAVGATWSALEQEEPPDLLDQSVLSAARRAVTEPGLPPRRPLRWPVGWLGAFATAAVLVLTVTVVLMQNREAPVPPPPVMDGYELERPAATAKLEAAAQEAAQAESSEARSARQPAPAAAADMEQDLAGPTRQASPAGPEDWIERLRKLKTKGDSAAFERELASFRATYPAYPLPPELLD